MSAELLFIMKMRDEASAFLSKQGAAFNSAGNAAGKYGKDVNRAGSEVATLAKRAKEATVALAGLYTVKKAGGTALSSFREFELGITNVVKTTDMAGAELSEFEQKFDALAQSMQGVGVKPLQEISAAAGQMGVRGAQNIIDFTEVLGKLAVTSDLVGYEGAKSVMRLLTVTGEGVKQVRTFGDVINVLGNTTAATEREIVHMASSLGASTAQFKLGSTALAGLGAAAAQLDLRPELFGTSVGRTLTALANAAQNGGRGMRMLSEATGLTQDQFAKLIKDDPAAAFQKFLNVLQALQADGQTVNGFLAQFNLQGEENIKVLGTAASQAQLFAQKLKDARDAAAAPGALNKEYTTFAAAMDSQIKGVENSWGIATKNIGKAMAPAAKEVLASVKEMLDGLNAVFTSLPDYGQKFVAFGSLAAGALLVIVPALSLLSAALRVSGVASLVAFIAKWSGLRLVATAALLALRLSLVAVFGFIQGFAGVFIAAFGIVPVLVAAAIAAFVALGVAIYRNWESITAFFSQSWKDIGAQIVEAIVNAFTMAMAKAKQVWTDFWSWVSGKESAQTPGTLDAAAAGRNAGAALAATKPGGGLAEATQPSVDGTINKGAVSSFRGLTDSQRKALESLDNIRKVEQELKDQQDALNALKRLPTESQDYRSPTEIGRLQAQVDQKKRQLDPVGGRLREMDREIASAQAVTKADKDRLEVLEEIRKMEEQIGVVTGQQAAALSQRVSQLSAATRQVALNEAIAAATRELELARATTEQDRTRLQIKQQIAEFEKQNGRLSDEQRQAYEGVLSAKAQAEAFSQLRGALDPLGEATRNYEQSVRTLNQALADGTISTTKFQQMLSTLQQQTLQARDPYAAQVQSLNDQMNLLKIRGDYADADRKTEELRLQLLREGKPLLDEQIASLKQMNRQLQDAQKAESSGLQGWMNGIGSMRDNMMDLTKDFASGLSSAISGSIQGKKGVWTQFLSGMSGKLIDTGVNQLLKTSMQGFQGQMGDMGSWFTNLFGGGKSGGSSGGIGGFFSSLFGTGSTSGAASTLGSAASQMAGTMMVTAGTVIVNGGVGSLAGLAGGAGGTGSSAGGVASSLPGLGSSNAGPANVNIQSVAGSSLTKPAIPFQMAGTSTAGASSTGVVGGFGRIGSSGTDAFGLDGFKAFGGAANNNLPPGIGTIGKSGLDQFGIGGVAGTKLSPFGDLENAKAQFSKLQESLPNPFKNGVGMGKGPFGDLGTGVLGDTGAKKLTDLMPDLSSKQLSKMIKLDPKEITDLKKTVATEWVQSSGDAQGQGIVDTILNRKASGKWGDSVTDVVNSRKQFSDINGPPAWKAGRSSVDDLPMSRIDPRTNKLVDDWLSKRSQGAPSSIGDNLNYANPNYSDARNRGWIDRLDGPVLGKGDAIHKHGTVPELDRYRPGEFGVQLPKQRADFGTSVPGSDQLQQMQEQASKATQQMQQSVTQNFSQMGQSVQTVGQTIGQTVPQFAQMGSQLGQLAPQLTQAIPGFSGLTGGLQSMMGPLTQGPGAASGFASSLSQLVQSMSSGMGGGGGLFSMLGGLFHEGGKVGSGHPASGYRLMPASAFAGAPRLHTGGGQGLNLSSDEYTSILRRGERVLTNNQDSRTTGLISGLADAVQSRSAAAPAAAQKPSGRGVTQVFNISTPDASSFRKSQSQVMATSSVHMSRASTANN